VFPWSVEPIYVGLLASLNVYVVGWALGSRRHSA